MLSHNQNLVTVDFVGGDGTKGSIPCLKDHDGDHERGCEAGGEGVCIFAGHLFWLLLGGEGPSPALTGTRRPKDGLTSPGAFGLAPNPAGGTGSPRSPTPRGLISKTGFGPRKGLASGGWYFDTRSRIVPLMLTPPALQTCFWLTEALLGMEPLVPRADARDRLVLDERPACGGPPWSLRRLGRRCPPSVPSTVRFEIESWLFAAVAFAQGGKPSGQVHPDMQEVNDDHPVWRGNKDHIMLPGPGLAQVFGQ